jgi:hypothetical protein
MAGHALDPKVAAERLNERAKGTNIAGPGTRFLEVSRGRAGLSVNSWTLMEDLGWLSRLR